MAKGATGLFWQREGLVLPIHQLDGRQNHRLEGTWSEP